VTVGAVFDILTRQLVAESEPDVRATLLESIGRLPYARREQASRAETALVERAPMIRSIAERVGLARGLESLARLERSVYVPSPETIVALRSMSIPDGTDAASGPRVRRLALEALIRVHGADDFVVERAAQDGDPQVRRLAMRAASGGSELTTDLLARGLADSSPMVRIEALRALRVGDGEALCRAAVRAARDTTTAVAIVALDELSACGRSAEAVALLEGEVDDVSRAGLPRSWHPVGHALVALAIAAPDRAAPRLFAVAASRVWQLRMYAARAAAALADRTALEGLALDENDNVREAAIDGLARVAGHTADATYVAQLSRSGYQVLRAAARALEGGSPAVAGISALRGAFDRLTAEGRDNSAEARAAIVSALDSLGAPPRSPRRAPQSADSELSADELRRLAAPRARIVVRDLGTIDVALIASEAPATVLRFARLAESGYYSGLTFHRVEPNFVVQGGSPGANEYIGAPAFMRDEIGHWPHVRGTVGLSTRGRDTGDAQFFIDLVDAPRLDHEYTVFGQVLNGLDMIDEILEGDVIERIDIISGP
jgi:cyclophilin family peptidyl-prolyl cis-trans isomerase